MKHILYIFLSLLLSFPLTSNAFASANDFYFEDATFDYYLDKEKDLGASLMYVTESLTAVFPHVDQNHGIERCIPDRYRGVKTLDQDSFTVLRNGTTEPFTTYDNNGLVCFRIGSASTYVHGQNTYQISYNLQNIILEPDNSENQELYWDTNGTAWSQPFYHLTATVHLPNYLADAWNKDHSCYVGVYGLSDTEATSRCTTSVSTAKTETIITFTTQNLAARENLTLDLSFAPKTFTVKKDLRAIFTAIFATLGAALLAIASFFSRRRAKNRNAEKISLAQSPKPVQYIPPKNLTVAQAAKVRFAPTSANLKIAALMELAVTHKISLEKAEITTKILKTKKTTWKIHAQNLSDISSEQQIVLDILNGGTTAKTNDTIEVKTQTATSKLQRLAQRFDTDTETALINHCFFTHKKDRKFWILAPTYNKYEKRTLKGIETSNYLDGLEEYIKLAEKDRIKFLHSVKTADVSPQGIVKLYEKLLPYAIIFNCEDSWLKELNKYYQMPEVNDPDWLMAGYLMSSRDFTAFRTATASSISSAAAYQSSSSSGSSGGGGGGFSGGGGGGGGGGGW